MRSSLFSIQIVETFDNVWKYVTFNEMFDAFDNNLFDMQYLTYLTLHEKIDTFKYIW